MTHDPYNAPSGSSAMGSGSSAMGGASAGMSSGATAGGTRSTGAADQSVGQLLSDISADMSTLMRQELELAKAELRQEASLATTAAKEEASKAGKAAAMFGAAGYIGHFAFLFVSLALWWLIKHILGDFGTHWGWAFLIVAVLYGIIAAVLALSGKKKMKDVNFGRLSQINPKPEQTIETLQEVPGALKPSN